LSFLGKSKSKLDLSLSRVEGGWSLLDHDLLPFLSGWLVHYGREVIFHLSKEIVVGRHIEVVDFQVKDVVFRIGRMHEEFFVPIGIQSFLDDFGLVRLTLSLDSEFNIRVRSSSQISCLDSSRFHDSDEETRLVLLLLSLLLVHVSARHWFCCEGCKRQTTK